MILPFSLLFSQNIEFLKYNKNNIISTIKMNTIDKYSFSYNSTNSECRLEKNNSKISLFDERFDVPKPSIRAYRCPAWIKERYSICKIVKSKSVSSVALSFGRFDRTNLLIAFNPDYYKADDY